MPKNYVINLYMTAVFNFSVIRWIAVHPAARGHLVESWLALTICLEVSKPVRFDGS